MTPDPDGVDVRRGTSIAPSDPDGSQLFAGLLGIDDPGGVGTFPYRLEGKQVLEPHTHTAAIAACITAGSMRFGFGDAFTESVEVGRGDYIAIAKDVAHAEEVTSVEPAEMIVAHGGAFETRPA